MSDSIEANEVPDELESLKARADMMGIKYHPKTGVDKLKAKINNVLEGKSPDEDDFEEVAPVVAKEAKQAKARTKSGKPVSKLLTNKEFREHDFSVRQREAQKLVRIRITCMNPNKKNWEGEIISVGSAKMGTLKKYVPFDAPNGWHVPNMILQELKDRKFTTFFTVTGPRGNKIRKGKLVPEFSVEVLPPLTAGERQELIRQQALAEGSAVD